MDAAPVLEAFAGDAAVADATADVEGDTGVPPCDEVDAFVSQFPHVLATWAKQDAIGGWPDSPVVFAGSSSVRRWEGLSQAYTDFSPLQRGFGGAQLGEIARYAHELVAIHNPRAVVLYAGTNDVSANVTASVVVDRFRCFRHRVAQELGWDRPVLYVGITPTPARWNEWPIASAVNSAVEALASSDPGLTYVDVATPFLATGSPPSASLFVSDGLHLTESGYALWNSVLRPAVEKVTPPTVQAASPSPPLQPGSRILIDLGPSNPEDGELSPSPDYLGQHWNNWHAVDGDVEVLAGEQKVALRTSDGALTGIDLVVAGGLLGNGRSHGGLLWPDAALLGNLAVGSATGDFFYTAGEDTPGALFLRGLDPGKSYRLQLFAARDDPEKRVTRYTITGASSSTATLQTSGPGAGHNGATTNDDDIVAVTGVKPDGWGHVFIDVAIAEGAYGYLSILVVEAE
jgi:hypothetical protein